jgi:hypothetical protein
MAWQCISPEVSVKGYKKCCISIAVDETGNLLWIGNEDNGNVRSDSEEDEGTDSEGGESGTDWRRQNLICVVY